MPLYMTHRGVRYPNIIEQKGKAQFIKKHSTERGLLKSLPPNQVISKLCKSNMQKIY